jgi:hypothetical protein
MEIKKIAIIGSRTLSDYNLIEEKVKAFIEVCNCSRFEIVSGGAKGVDSLAKIFAQKYNYKLVEFLPDYKTHGRSAPLRRNKQIVDYADIVFAFQSNQSKGTQSVIDYARNKFKSVRVFQV